MKRISLVTLVQMTSLYDSIVKMDLPEHDLTPEEKETLVSSIKNLDQPRHELLYALIRIHQLRTTQGPSTFNVPYKGKHIKNNCRFDLNDIPIQLRQIMSEFLKLHLNSKNEQEDTLMCAATTERI